MVQKDNKMSKFRGGFTRRELLALLGWTSLAGTNLCAAGGLLRFLVPNVLLEGPSRVKIGTPNDFSPDSITFLEDNQVFLLRETKGFRAMSAVCTHLGCLVNKEEGSSNFNCPCHGSRFDRSGNVTKGPAPAPLPMLELSLSPNGQLVVDLKKPVDRDRFLSV